MSEDRQNKSLIEKNKDKRKRAAGRLKVDANEMLVKGEEIIEEALIHDGIYWQSLAVLIFSIVVGVFMALELGFFLAIVALLMFVYATVRKEILLLVLTNKRILVRYGILQVDVVDIRFDKIESIELERMATGYLMGYSNVVVMGTGNRYIVIPYVANGAEIRRSFNRLTLTDEEE